MNKLESIKERLNTFKNDWKASRGCCDVEDFSEDVEHLLQRLERYEKALEHYAKVDNWYPDDYKGTQIFIWDDNTKPWEVAEQALEIN